VENFAGTDLGWREGMATWQPLAQIFRNSRKVAGATAAAGATTIAAGWSWGYASIGSRGTVRFAVG